MLGARVVLLLLLLSYQTINSYVSDSSLARLTSGVVSGHTKQLDRAAPVKNKGYEILTDRTDESRREKRKFRIKFLLRNWKMKRYDELAMNILLLPDSWVNEGPVKILVHGYSNMNWYKKDKDAFKVLKSHVFDIADAYGNKNESINVILVDWTVLGISGLSRYDYVVENVKTVGEVVGAFLVALARAEVQDYERFHLIGYAMGAHIAGVAGKLFIKENNFLNGGRKVGRITGIDPAGAGFAGEDTSKMISENNSLTKYDADFVDVMHCSGSTNNIYAAQALGQYGSDVVAGHADFFPNGGAWQPGCKMVNEVRIDKACSVKTCVQYFVDTINGVKYYGCPCPSHRDYEAKVCECVEKLDGMLMGDPCNPRTRGKFFLNIDPVKPSDVVKKHV